MSVFVAVNVIGELPVILTEYESRCFVVAEIWSVSVASSPVSHGAPTLDNGTPAAVKFDGEPPFRGWIKVMRMHQ